MSSVNSHLNPTWSCVGRKVESYYIYMGRYFEFFYLHQINLDFLGLGWWCVNVMMRGQICGEIKDKKNSHLRRVSTQY